MKKPILIISIVIIASLMLSACSLLGIEVIRGNGKLITETREVTGFTGISVGSGMQVTLTQGDTFLTISAEENIMPYIRSHVENGILIIELRGENDAYVGVSTLKGMKVAVGMPEITSIDISGGGSLDAGTITAEDLSLTLSGGSNGKLDAITASTFDVNFSGGSRATFTGIEAETTSFELSGGSSATIEAGKADANTINASGGSNFYADAMETSQTTVSASGGGSTKIWVTDQLDVDASGGATVYYYGNPAVNESTSGGSNVISKGTK